MREIEIVKRVDKNPLKISMAEFRTYDMFFRQEHPDNRSPDKWLKAVEKKLFMKRMEKKYGYSHEIK